MTYAIIEFDTRIERANALRQIQALDLDFVEDSEHGEIGAFYVDGEYPDEIEAIFDAI